MLFFRANPLPSPGVHALIVGVSQYAHLPAPDVAGAEETFGLHRLRSPALSAVAFARWLLANQASLAQPLASIRLLVAPSAEELASPKWPAAWDPAYVETAPDWAAFNAAVWAWRADLAASDDEVGVFYFAGHGIQLTKDDAIMLMADFGAPGRRLLDAGVQLKNVVEGLSRSVNFPIIAQTQFYFLDACRVRPPAVGGFSSLQAHNVFDVVSLEDVRATPILYAAASEQEAEARVGGVSYFCEALLGALEVATEGGHRIRGAVRYPVTPEILREVVALRLIQLNARQKPMLGGTVSAVTFSYLPGQPQVDIVLSLAPAAHIPAASVSLTTPGFHHTFAPAPAQHPYSRPVPMGVYDIKAWGRGVPRIEYQETINHRHSKLDVELG